MQPIFNMLARRVSVESHLLNHLPNPDPILKRSGQRMSVYRDLLNDAHVGGCVKRRKSAVLSRHRVLLANGADDRIVQWVDEALDRIDLDKFIVEAMDATLYGYQPLEINWTTESGHHVIDSVDGKPSEWFFFDADNRVRLRTRQALQEGILLPEKKFLIFTQEASYVNPYGVGDLSRCFWPVQFKRGGLKFWVTFTERFGSPWVIGRHPRGSSISETDEMLNRLEDMVQDAIAVIPDDSSIEIVEASGRSTSSEAFEKLMYYCRSEIAMALLGQNQTTEVNSNLASAKAGLEVMESITDADCKLIQKGLNQMIRWLVDFNFGSSVIAPVYVLKKETMIDSARIDRDKKLHEMGIQLSKGYYVKHHGLSDSDML